MASSASLPSPFPGFVASSNSCVQCEHSFHTRRKPASSHRLFLFPLSPLLRQYGCHSASFIHKSRLRSLGAIEGDDERPQNPDDDEEPSSDGNNDELDGDVLRKKLENILGNDDDAQFSGKDLAMLIRNKYGRSYDVQLIKKEFMGRQLLAMNVMWKYREQRSFPLTEEEYLLRLDDVANNLKCWGAVSYVRNSLAKTKERPRIGKAVSIFIDLDESGGRANEWIYR